MNPEYVTYAMFFILTVQLVCNLIHYNTDYISLNILNNINLGCCSFIWGMLIGKWMVLL